MALKGGRPGSRVNPRGCGETIRSSSGATTSWGQSPRVRGNRDRHDAGKALRGSIPAGAGKPVALKGGRPGSRVNPRGCGETIRSSSGATTSWGQSPRVRGNRDRHDAGKALRGSIPAGAGKPVALKGGRPGSRVNPRGCGETIRSSSGATTSWGQSPRVRGNRDRHDAGKALRGSIPAGAGKPVALKGGRPGSRVNPRGCGETAPIDSRAACSRGQSPRVRGNRSRPRVRDRRAGSIPAGAGKPALAYPFSLPFKVNPRGCGETP